MRSASANTASMSCSTSTILTSRRNSCNSLTMRADSVLPSPAIGPPSKVGAFTPHLLQKPAHARRFGAAEPGHRLVEQQQLRPGRERHRQFELALLAMAEL